jgi:hypothetical protein
VIDRGSTFAHPEIVAALQADFVPVAIDQAYQRRQKDAEGVFYRKIAGAGPRRDFNNTTQGMYIAAPDGKFLGYTNSRSPHQVKKSMDTARAQYIPQPVSAVPVGRKDPRFNPEPPEGGLVIRVQAKVLAGYAETQNPTKQVLHQAVSRDNLWLTAEEHREIVYGRLPESVKQRIARFHLVDNTRGEPPMWKSTEIVSMSIQLDDGKIRGKVSLASPDGTRGYEAELYGVVRVTHERVVALNMVAKGIYWGEGTYTRGAPEGRFPLGVSFTLSDGTDLADAIPPQGSRGWLDGYMKLIE